MVERLGRVFAAVPLPPELREALAEDLTGLAIPGRLVPAENWHLTIRFLGTVETTTFERFLSRLDLEDESQFRIRLGRIGAFPNPRRATVVWIGVEEGATELVHLAEIAEEAAQVAGVEAEERPFHPHLTISRVRPPSNVGELTDHRVDLSWRCDRVVVYRSHLGRGGARYEPLESIRLTG